MSQNSSDSSTVCRSVVTLHTPQDSRSLPLCQQERVSAPFLQLDPDSSFQHGYQPLCWCRRGVEVTLPASKSTGAQAAVSLFRSNVRVLHSRPSACLAPSIHSVPFVLSTLSTLSCCLCCPLCGRSQCQRSLRSYRLPPLGQPSPQPQRQPVRDVLPAGRFCMFGCCKT